MVDDTFQAPEGIAAWRKGADGKRTTGMNIEKHAWEVKNRAG